MTRRKAIFGVVAVALLAAVVLLVCWTRPWVHVSVDRQLVGPGDEAMNLLLQGAPLDQIQAAVRRSGKHVDQITHLGGTLLFYATAEKRIDVAQWLLKEGANPNGVWNGFGGAPLAEAISKQDVAMVRLLLAGGADPDLEMTGGTTPRKYAQSLDNPDILAALPPERPAATRAVTEPAAGMGIGGHNTYFSLDREWGTR